MEDNTQPHTSPATSQPERTAGLSRPGSNSNGGWFRSALENIGRLIRDMIFQDSADGRGKEIKWNAYLGAAVAAGFLILYLFARNSPAGWQLTGSLFLLAGSALAAGIMIGFLFGIPRARQQANASAEGQSAGEGYAVNTNLEQISDWLTKIIVGVGLIQLATFPGKLKALAGYFATVVGNESVTGSLVLAILGFFSIFGFLIGYLWARIYLTGEFSRAERVAKDQPEYYEGLIHAYLYQPKPKGFRNAIRESELYIKRFGESVRVWEYLACAHGQQYSYLKRAPQRNDAAMDEVKAKALEAIKRAIQIDPEAKDFLKPIWEKAMPGEDDLHDFYGFPEFKEVFKEDNEKLTV